MSFHVFASMRRLTIRKANGNIYRASLHRSYIGSVVQRVSATLILDDNSIPTQNWFIAQVGNDCEEALIRGPR